MKSKSLHRTFKNVVQKIEKWHDNRDFKIMTIPKVVAKLVSDCKDKAKDRVNGSVDKEDEKW